MPRKKKPTGKRIKVDVWVGEGLRAAVGALAREDGKLANDTQVRAWAQSMLDNASAVEVAKFEQHTKARKRRGQ